MRRTKLSKKKRKNTNRNTRKNTRKYTKKNTNRNTRKNTNRNTRKNNRKNIGKAKKHSKHNENLFKMISYESNYSNIDGDVNKMERKVISDNNKTDIWEKKNDKITQKTIQHNKKNRKQFAKSHKIELSDLKPLHSFELPYLVNRDPFYDFIYKSKLFNHKID